MAVSMCGGSWLAEGQSPGAVWVRDWARKSQTPRTMPVRALVQVPSNTTPRPARRAWKRPATMHSRSANLSG